MNDKRVIGRLRDVVDDGDPFDAMDKLGWNAAYFFFDVCDSSLQLLTKV